MEREKYILYGRWWRDNDRNDRTRTGWFGPSRKHNDHPCLFDDPFHEHLDWMESYARAEYMYWQVRSMTNIDFETLTILTYDEAMAVYQMENL